ncbi:MAG: alpha/beta hydrolase family protein [Gammaproteobacteria bacterium]
MKYYCLHSFGRWLWLALIFLAVPVSSYAQSATGVGFASIKIPDPVNGGTKPGYVFYPSTAPSGVTRIGPYKLHAIRNGPPVPGAKPLVVIAHGHGGSDLSHHDLAVYLASHGFVIATLQFPKDNYTNYKKNTGTPQVLDGRPIQVKATISMLLHDPHWKTLIDPNKIGEAGFSAGGYTALRNVGAVPQFSRFVTYCQKVPQDKQICSSLQKLQSNKTAQARLAALQNDVDKWGNPDDPRVKSAFVMAPLSLIFDKAGLSHINRPVFLYDGGDDQVLRLKYNTLHIAPLIKTLVGIKILPKAGHYVFLGPCSKELAKASLAEPICKVPPGVNRVKVIAQVNADALAFFRGTLHVLPTL